MLGPRRLWRGKAHYDRLHVLGVNFAQSFLAFAPGALEVLIVLAYQVDADPAYVAAHHVVRFLALVAAVPLLARWLARHP